MSPPGLRTRDFKVGWICAILSEHVVACQMLDEEYHDAPSDFPAHDNNVYTYGRIGSHHVVIACLPKGRYGKVPAASVSRDMDRSFPALRFVMMVGIGDGAPTERCDVRLGDVVVSEPFRRTGGVIHYDHGKTIQNRAFEPTGSFNKPPAVVLSAMQKLSGRHKRNGHNIAEIITTMVYLNPRLARTYQRPDGNTDVLYKSSLIHTNDQPSCSAECAFHTEDIVHRPQRPPGEDDPCIHYGLIASADQLMKDAILRDALAEKEGVLCFEMEAAGLMDNIPCLVVRGISDYSDTHKNDLWQGYAAATAAAYARELLLVVPGDPQQLSGEQSHDLNAIVEDKMSFVGTQLSDDSLQTPTPSIDATKATSSVTDRIKFANDIIMKGIAFYVRGENKFSRVGPPEEPGRGGLCAILQRDS